MILSHEKKWLNALLEMAQIFSTCSRRQYAAIVIDKNKRVVGFGYNGAPPGMKHCIDGGCPRGASNVVHGSQYNSGEGFCVAQHAEAGALLWSDPSRRNNATLIVNGPPCMDCARLIASSGVKRVVFGHDPEYTGFSEVEEFLSKAGVDMIGSIKYDHGY